MSTTDDTKTTREGKSPAKVTDHGEKKTTTTTTSKRVGERRTQQQEEEERESLKAGEGGEGEKRRPSLSVGVRQSPHEDERERGGDRGQGAVLVLGVGRKPDGGAGPGPRQAGGARRIRKTGAFAATPKLELHQHKEDKAGEVKEVGVGEEGESVETGSGAGDAGSNPLWRKARLINRFAASLSPRLKRKSVAAVSAAVSAVASGSPRLHRRNMPIISSPSGRRGGAQPDASTAAPNGVRRAANPLVPRRDFVVTGENSPGGRGLSAAGSIKRNHMRSSSRLLAVNTGENNNRGQFIKTEPSADLKYNFRLQICCTIAQLGNAISHIHFALYIYRSVCLL